LTATRATQAIYAAVVLAAVARIGAALAPAWSASLLHITVVAWTAAFVGFAVLFGPILLRANGPFAAPQQS
jgi:uncharacterized protein involved in response to NO